MLGRKTAVVLALLLGLAAAGLVLRADEPPGPGLDPDSMSYLAAADSIAAEGQPRVPFNVWTGPTDTRRLKDFPPGFSAAIAALEEVGVSNQRGAVAIEAASAFATISGIVL